MGVKILSNSYFVKREFCPGCKSGSHSTIYSCRFSESPIKEFIESYYGPGGRITFEYLNGAKFILNRCNVCGMIYQEEIPNDFFMKILYDEGIEPQKIVNQYKEYDNVDYYSVLAKEVMMIIAYFNRRPSQLKFFDFGMGWGKWCRMAKAFGCDAYGTELSESRIEYAKSQAVKVIALDEIPEYSFDFINMEQILEHIPEPLETLCYLKKSLKPEGLLKISVPNGGDIKRGLKILDWTAPKGSKNSLNPVSALEHINCFNHSSIIKMTDLAGLELMKIPLSIQYVYSTNWKPIKRMVKNILGPLYRNLFKKSTYLFFRQKRK